MYAPASSSRAAAALERDPRASENTLHWQPGTRRRCGQGRALQWQAPTLAMLLFLAGACTPFLAAGQINEDDTDSWVVTLGRQPIRIMLGSDSPDLAPSFALGPALPLLGPSVPTGAAPRGMANSPLSGIATATVTDRFRDANVAVAQQAAQRALSPRACDIQVIDFNNLSPDMLTGCTHLPKESLASSPDLAQSQLCRMLPTYKGLTFSSANETLPWLVIDMVMTNGMGGAYCSLRKGYITPQGGVNGSCTLLQTTWLRDSSYNVSHLAEGAKIIRPVAANTTFTIHQLTAIVQAPGVLIRGVRDDDTVLEKSLKHLETDGTTITKFNPALWTNLYALQFIPAHIPEEHAFTSMQMFKLQVSFC